MAQKTWEIDKREFFKRLHCSEEEFERQLFVPEVKKVRHIVPLRNLAHVESIMPISKTMLKRTISKILTLDGARPFEHVTPVLRRVDPRELRVGQKYVYRENYQNLLENLSGLFDSFAIEGSVTSLAPHFAFGLDSDGIPSLAFYLPPIIEQHNNELVIMDGIHRDYIVKQLGGTILAILIPRVSIPFPCGIHPWSDVQVIGANDKPPNIEDRYFELNKNLFRNLKYLGIDG